MARSLITFPSNAKTGDLIELRCLIAHPMETGYRVDEAGHAVLRNIIRHFTVRLEGVVVFEAECFPAVAANPLFSFWLRAERSGTLRFEWAGDQGFAQTEERALTVT